MQELNIIALKAAIRSQLLDAFRKDLRQANNSSDRNKLIEIYSYVLYRLDRVKKIDIDNVDFQKLMTI